MYTYPNPLNAQIDVFFLRHVVVAKKADFDVIDNTLCRFTEEIVRKDKFDNMFRYYLDDELENGSATNGALKTLTGIFDFCKVRRPKERVAAIPVLRKLP